MRLRTYDVLPGMPERRFYADSLSILVLRTRGECYAKASKAAVYEYHREHLVLGSTYVVTLVTGIAGNF